MWRVNCAHLNTRCIHGDDILYHMKIYTIRWWKEDIVYRQICADCGKRLDRLAICTATGDSTRHTWTGPWEFWDVR